MQNGAEASLIYYMGTSEDTEGSKLFNQVTDLTELPKEDFSSELHDILLKSGADPDNMTIDDLRRAALIYLEEVFGELPEENLE